MTRKEWYEMEHRFRLEERLKRQAAAEQTLACRKRMQFRRAVKAMFVNRAVKTVIESNIQAIEDILKRK